MSDTFNDYSRSSGPDGLETTSAVGLLYRVYLASSASGSDSSRHVKAGLIPCELYMPAPARSTASITYYRSASSNRTCKRHRVAADSMPCVQLGFHKALQPCLGLHSQRLPLFCVTSMDTVVLTELRGRSRRGSLVVKVGVGEALAVSRTAGSRFAAGRSSRVAHSSHFSISLLFPLFVEQDMSDSRWT